MHKTFWKNRDIDQDDLVNHEFPTAFQAKITN